AQLGDAPERHPARARRAAARVLRRARGAARQRGRRPRRLRSARRRDRGRAQDVCIAARDRRESIEGENAMKRFAIVLAVGLAGCASSAVTPDWVSGAAGKYPPSRYLVGRGEAEGGEEARDRARADLAKVFEVRVAVESEDEQAFRMDGTDDRYESRTARRVSA